MEQLADSVIKLARDTLDALPDGVQRPLYSAADIKPGIVHIGLGNFHRAHQAWYVHQLMQSGKAMDWGIIGAGVRSYDADMRQKLLAQDCLTTLIELDPAGVSAQVIGPMVDYLPIESGNATLIRQMSDPAIRIVSLTVTEGGYYLDPTTGAFDTSHDDVRHDVQHPDQPRTVFGAIVAALGQRKSAGVSPFTALSCDNLQGNGAILRRCVVGLARMSDPDLADWIDQNGAFPNSMVDCIVPATTDQVKTQTRALGIDDRAPVTHENFRQWVIEDAFCAGRPPLEDVGATITKDVHPYEAMKLRILNGGHQILANVGEVLNIPTISACMQDRVISDFFATVQARDILGHVASVPGMTPANYLNLITRRFENTAIHDTTRRVAFDGSSRHPGFLLPTLRDALDANTSISGLALAEAFWCRMCEGTREDGTEIAANDPIWDQLQDTAKAARLNPMLWIENAKIYGSLGQDDRFGTAFANWLEIIWKDGCRHALQTYLAQPA